MEKIDLTSGILELYVSGALPPEQMEEISQQISKSPELKAEVERIEASFIAFAETMAPKISQSRKAALLNIGKTASTTSPKSSFVEPTPEAKVIPIRSKRWRLVAVASVILLLLSMAFNFLQYQDLQQKDLALQQKDQELAILKNQDEILSNNLNSLQAKYRQNQQFLADIRDPQTETVILNGNGVNFSADQQVRVYWNEDRQLAYIDALNLPPPPQGKTYQLWRLSSLNPITPHDAGLLDGFMENEEKIFNKTISGTSVAFAITLEPEGGSESPTLEQLYVLGLVGG